MKKKIYIVMAALSLCAGKGWGQEVLSLEQSRKLALEYNQKIKIANELILENQANKRYAYTQFLPDFSINGEYNYYHDIEDIEFPGFFLPKADDIQNARKGKYSGESNVYFPGINLKMGNIDYYSASLNVMQPIYMGGKIKSGYEMSKLAIQISGFNKQLQTADVLMETDEAYWNFVSVKEKVVLAKKYVEMLTALVRDLNNAFDLELVTKNELLKVQVQLNKAKLELFRAENAYQLSKMALCQVIGKDLQADIVALDSVVVTRQDEMVAGYMTKAMQQRPEIQMLSAQVELDDQVIKNTQSDYLPQLGVGASYSYTSDIEDLINSQQILVAKASLSIPIFHWGERKHRISIVKSKKRQQELTLGRTKDLIGLEVQQSYFNLQEAVQQIELAEVSMTQADENVELTKNSFYEGLANTTELLDAQAFWQQAHSELIDAKINYKLREVGFRKATGDLGNI